MEFIIIALVLVIVAMKVYDRMTYTKTRKRKNAPNSAPMAQQSASDPNGRSDYNNCYQRKYLLTKNEWHAYKKLKQIAEANGLQVCPKVRLLDIVEPRKGEKDYQSLFWKVQAKHVDFLICDKDLHIKAVLELDDSSHEAKERKDRDSFVDEVLTSVGYKVIRTHYITETVLDGLTEPNAGETDITLTNEA